MGVGEPTITALGIFWFMNPCVTFDAQSDQVFQRIISEGTPKTEMVYL